MKMKTLAAAAAAFTLTAGIFLPGIVSAEQDFSQYSNEELVQLRTHVRDMNGSDRARFREEMQNRMRNMSTAERERLGIGAVQDGQMRQRTNEGMNRNQEPLRSESGDGYGRGYGARQGGRGQ
jgi:hypothetical protein